jgi:hypothetical protein
MIKVYHIENVTPAQDTRWLVSNGCWVIGRCPEQGSAVLWIALVAGRSRCDPRGSGVEMAVLGGFGCALGAF